MSMRELAAEYRQSADLLNTRIRQLEKQQKKAQGLERARLSVRIVQLQTMWRQTRDTANTLEHYYDGSPSVEGGER